MWAEGHYKPLSVRQVSLLQEKRKNFPKRHLTPAKRKNLTQVLNEKNSNSSRSSARARPLTGSAGSISLRLNRIKLI